jgi:hypothetical protein
MAKGKNALTLLEVMRKDQPQVPLNPRPVRTVAAPPTGDSLAAAPAGGGEDGELHLRMTRTTAFMAVMGVLALLVAAYLAGQRSVADPRPALAPSTGPELLQGQPNPAVVVVGRPVDAGFPDTPEAGDSRAGRPPARIVGLNYVVIQSYPEQELAMAEEAVKYLQTNGLDATIEKNLPRWSRANWYTVVGTVGFERISSPEYQAYVRKVQDISNRYAKPGSFKAFEPKPYSWGRTN